MKDEARRIAANIAKLPELFASPKKIGPPRPRRAIANGWLDLLLFCGIALHVKIIAFSPRLTTFHASGVPCLTMFCASVAPRLTTKLLKGSHLSLVLNEHFEEAGESVFSAACQLGCEGIVSKRLGSPDRSGRSPNWVKVKYPKAPAVRREAEEDWGSPHWIKNRKKRAVTRGEY